MVEINPDINNYVKCKWSKHTNENIGEKTTLLYLVSKKLTANDAGRLKGMGKDI